jgi:NACHT domain
MGSSLDPSTTSDGKPTKYFFGWVAAQAPLVIALILGRKQAQDNLAAAGAITAVWMAMTSFLTRLVKELEDDAVHSTARFIRAIPRASADLARRLLEAGTVWLTRRGFTRRYCRFLKTTYGLFNDRGLGLINSNRLDLDRVYVELRASTDPQLARPAANPLGRDIRGSVSFWDHLRSLREGITMVIVGVPGSGKTTLLHHVLLTFARNRQWRFRMRTRLPFFIPLHKAVPLIVEGAETNSATLAKVLASVLENTLQGLGTLPEKWLDREVKNGRCLFLFDGLDEVADPVSRRAVSAWVDTQTASLDHQRHLFVVTARPLGYKEAPLARPHVLEVQPFSYDDSCRFIHKWYLANEIVSHGNRCDEDVRIRAKSGSADLISRLGASSRLADLMVNPLLLTMVCMVHRYQGALPGNRGELYQEICQVLLERWRQSRGFQDTVRAGQKLDVLRPLAAHLMQSHVRNFSLDDPAIRAVVEPPFALIGIPTPPRDGRDALTTFFLSLQASSGLILELSTGPSGRWCFAHHTFQEFLCAEHWNATPASTPESFSPIVVDAWWREALLLYSARAKDASPIARAAVDSSNEEAHAFAFALLEEKPSLTADVRQDIEHKLIDALHSRNIATFMPAARAFLRRRVDSDYRRLDEQNEISPWVSNVEYQIFLLADNELHTPLHWRGKWFSSEPQAPCLGMTALAADTFCQWLDLTFPQWKHGLVTTLDVPGTIPNLVSLRPGQARDAEVRNGVIQIAIALDLALDRARALALDLARDHALALALDLARHFDLTGDLARALGRGFSGDRLGPSTPKQPEWSDFLQGRHDWRSIGKHAIAILGESNAKLVSKEIAVLELWLDEIEARQQGLKEPVEGIRVIRQRRITRTG